MSSSALVDTLSSDVLITGVEKDCDCLCLGGGKASKLRRHREQAVKVGGAEKDMNRVAHRAFSDGQTASLAEAGFAANAREAGATGHAAKSTLTRSLSQPAAVSLALQQKSSDTAMQQQQRQDASERDRSKVTAANAADAEKNAHEAVVGINSTSSQQQLFDWLSTSDLDALFDGIFDTTSTTPMNPPVTLGTSSQPFAGFDSTATAFSAGSSSTASPSSLAIPPSATTAMDKSSNTAFAASPGSTAPTVSGSFTGLDVEKDSATVNSVLSSATNCPSTSNAHSPNSLVSLAAVSPSFAPPPHLSSSPSIMAGSQLQQQQSPFSHQHPSSSHPAKATLSRSLSQPVGVGAMAAQTTTSTATNVFHNVQQGSSSNISTTTTTQLSSLLTSGQAPPQTVPQLHVASGGICNNGSFEPSGIKATMSSMPTSSASAPLLLPPGRGGASTSSQSLTPALPALVSPSVTLNAGGVGNGTSPPYHVYHQNGLAPTSAAVRRNNDLRPLLLRTLSEPSSSSGSNNSNDVVEADERLARKLQEEEFVKGMRRSTHNDERLAMSLLANDLSVHQKRNVFEAPMAMNSGQSIQPPPVLMKNGPMVSAAYASMTATSPQTGAVSNNMCTTVADDQQHEQRSGVDWGSSKYPKCWSKCPSDSTQKYHLVDVEHSSPEWNTVSRPLMEAGFSVMGVQRIENETLWQRLCFEKQQLLKVRTNCNERFLYHTSRAEVSVICEEGLDPRLSQNGLFGTGIYFSDNPIKCDKYWSAKHVRERTMFCCRVLLGETKVYPKGRNERLKREPREYDSVKGNITGQDEYVIYNAYRVMPEYILRYYTSQPPQPLPPQHICGHAWLSLAQRRVCRRMCSQLPYYRPGMFPFPPQFPLHGGLNNTHLCPHSVLR